MIPQTQLLIFFPNRAVNSQQICRRHGSLILSGQIYTIIFPFGVIYVLPLRSQRGKMSLVFANERLLQQSKLPLNEHILNLIE